MNVRIPIKCLNHTITCNFTVTLLQLFIPALTSLVYPEYEGERSSLPKRMNPREYFPLKTSSYTLSPFSSYETLDISYSNHITKNLQSNITHSKYSQMSHCTLYILDLLVSLLSNHQLITGLTIEHQNSYICSDTPRRKEKISHFILELKWKCT